MMKEMKDPLFTCRGRNCYRTPVANCPRCGIPLCDECLARHAKFPGKAVLRRQGARQADDAVDEGSDDA